jgi:hypothetical protein
MEGKPPESDPEAPPAARNAGGVESGFGQAVQ